MALFQYKALEANGAPSQGTLEAVGRQDVVRILAGRGLTPLRVVESSETQAPGNERSRLGLPAGGIRWKSTKVSFAALEDFTRSLSSLLAANVPLSRALTILYKEVSNPAAAAQWRTLHDLVVDGMPLAQAMSRAPEVFPRVYVAMVESGEAGGFLDVVLGQIAEFQSREKELRAKIGAALMYPAVLLTLAIGVVIFLMVFFIPRFQTLFEGFNAPLPALTLAIVGVSNVCRHYGIFLVAGAAAAVWFGRHWLTHDTNRRRMEYVLLRSPIVGPIASKLAMARFCRMLGTLLGAGVSLISALSVARRSLGYQTLIDLVEDAAERVKKGEALSASLANCRLLFGGSTLEMIAVAEESGRLDQELLRISGVTEVVLDRNLKTAVSLAEPIMLFAIAGFIGTIFIGMVIPIFTIQDYIK